MRLDLSSLPEQVAANVDAEAVPLHIDDEDLPLALQQAFVAGNEGFDVHTRPLVLAGELGRTERMLNASLRRIVASLTEGHRHTAREIAAFDLGFWYAAREARAAFHAGIAVPSPIVPLAPRHQAADAIRAAVKRGVDGPVDMRRPRRRAEDFGTLPQRQRRASGVQH